VTESIKKLINKEIYEKDAQMPWAKFKDFILSADGKNIRCAVISSVSLIPILYIVEFDDFESISGVAVLKEGVRPRAVMPRFENEGSFEKIRKKEFFSEGKRFKIRDAYFDTEFGEVTDFVAKKRPVGRKIYFSPESDELSEIISKIREGGEENA